MNPAARKTMAKQPPDEESRPSSETVRLPIDLVFMLREIQLGEQKLTGKRPKLGELGDRLIRAAIQARHAEVKKLVKESENEE